MHFPRGVLAFTGWMCPGWTRSPLGTVVIGDGRHLGGAPQFVQLVQQLAEFADVDHPGIGGANPRGRRPLLELGHSRAGVRVPSIGTRPRSAVSGRDVPQHRLLPKGGSYSLLSHGLPRLAIGKPALEGGGNATPHYRVGCSLMSGRRSRPAPSEKSPAWPTRVTSLHRPPHDETRSPVVAGRPVAATFHQRRCTAPQHAEETL